MNSYYEKILATGDVKCIDEEIPFEIPATWNWARLSNITSILGDGIHGTPEYDATGTVYFINGNNLSNGSIEIKADTKKVSEQEAEKHKRLLNSTTVLVSINGTLGNVAFYNGENVILGKSACYFNLMGNIDKQYIKHILETEYFTEYAKNVATGSTIKNVPLAGMRNFLIPVPPITEQHRIILGMVRLAHSIVRYNDAQTKLDLLNNVLNEKLKKSVLQEAIQGKLVPQLAEEGTAQELLEQIKAEKEKLVKEGKLKKSALNNTVIFRGDDNKYYEQIGKKCLDITEQIPFDLPESWSWARGKSVFMPMESTKPSSDFVYIDVDAVNNRLNIIDNPKKVRFENAPSRATRKLHKNDLLFSMVRPYLKNIALVDDIYRDAIASTGFYVITPSLGYYPIFLFYLMLSNYVVDGLNAFMKGDNSPSINNCHIEDYLYPLPPIEEQKRIVNKIEQLFKQLR
ncbi:restriction endonuclease subunit S [Bacteroides ovatus]|uniref:restriction endonuclease subunit S n=1 Tax=Bacteroides ovatus TaxID=28116 RepID=UPI0023311A94|nr:restriction endonuclease subunit S [Bacteroides ovatus]MDC2658434.1 restriction endonuclease subunit S [Bacteroides ovatus]